jgi:hypothetical protein
MEFFSATKKNEILSFAGKWMELENIILREVRLRRPKITCSLSYAHCRTKPNVLDMGHTKGRTHGRNREREENQKFECG